MANRFPELTSYGTLLAFAHSLEETAAEFADHAGRCESCRARQAALQICGKRHRRRAVQMERIRRERLNEVVLQPISGMTRDRYIRLPDISLECSEEDKVVEAMVSIEEAVVCFYEDAAAHAENVLGGVERTFKKLANESADFIKAFREPR